MKLKWYTTLNALAILLLCFNTIVKAQNNVVTTDSVIRIIMESEYLTNNHDQGTALILNGNLSAAGQYYNTELKKDEGSREAYFGRGVVNFATADTMSACRDWSALLALGDTAAFKLLDAHCHGGMLLDDEVIPKIKYHRMFTALKSDSKSLTSNESAKVMADEMPEFVGGQSALIKYLTSSIKYPSSAHSKHISGTVYVSFVISSKGKILFPNVVRGIEKNCDSEALRVIRSMPAWKPGKQNGKPVLVRYTIPVIFRAK